MRILCLMLCVYLAVSGQAFIRLALAEDAAQPARPFAGKIQKMAEFDRSRIKQELMQLPPEERQKRLEEIRQKHQDKIKECHDDIEEKWQNADGRGREIICQKLQQECAEKAKKFACDVHDEKCRNQ